MTKEIDTIKPRHKYGLPIGITKRRDKYKVYMKIVRNGQEETILKYVDSLEDAIESRNSIISEYKKFINKKTYFYIICEGLYKEFEAMPLYVSRNGNLFQVIVSGKYIGSFQTIEQAVYVRDEYTKNLKGYLPKGIKKSGKGFEAYLTVPYIGERISLGTFKTKEKAIEVRNLVLKDMMG